MSLIARTQSTFDIREHLDKLTPANGKDRYFCPVCDGNNLSIDMNEGKYQCWSGCECKDIREVLSPARKPSANKNNKVISSPKNKPMPVAIDVKPELKRFSDDHVSIVWAYLVRNVESDGNTTYFNYCDKKLRMKKIGSGKGKKCSWEHVEHDGIFGKLRWEPGYGTYKPEIFGAETLCYSGLHTVLALEGQKDTVTALRLGIPAIDWKSATKEQFTELKEMGVHYLVAPPDNDDAGAAQSSKKADIAHECGIMAIVLNAPTLYDNMTKGYDFTDWVNDNGDDFDYVSAIEKQMMAVLEDYDSQPSDSASASDSSKASKKGKHATAVDEVASFYGGRLRANLVAQIIEKDGKPYEADNAFYDISAEMGLDLTDSFAFKAVSIIADRNAYSPVVEYLDSLKSVHPQVFEESHSAASERIKDIIKDILSLHDDLTPVLMMRTLISAVARAKDPGCKVDTMCILYGAQGFNKSTYWNILTGDDWFGTSLTGVRDDKEIRKMHSKWIHEFAELGRIFTRTDQESFKTYLDTRVDDVDVKYKRQIASLKRRCILVASTNRQDILRDSTGDRRYWVIPIHRRIDPHKVRQCRSELWALANHLYELGEQWWLTDDEQSQSSANNEAFKPMDVLNDLVRDYCWLQGDGCLRPSVTSTEVWQAIYPNESKSPDRKDLYPINEALTALSYFCGKPERYQGKVQRVWRLNVSNEQLHPCYEAVTPTVYSVEPICNNPAGDKTFLPDNADTAIADTENSLESSVEGNELQNDLKPSTGNCNSLVTAPVTACNSLYPVTESSELIHPTITAPQPVTEPSSRLNIATPKPITGTYIGTEHPYTDERVASAERLSDGKYLVKFIGRTTVYKIAASDFVPDSE